MIRKLPIFLFLATSTFLLGDVGKFLEPITLGKQTAYSKTKHFLKSSALIAPSSNLGHKDIELSATNKIELNRPLLEKKLSELSNKIDGFNAKTIEIEPETKELPER